MARPVKIKDGKEVVIRFAAEDYERVRDIAALETARTGKLVTTPELIRQAVKFVYDDNERLRENFRRSRESTARQY